MAKIRSIVLALALAACGGAWAATIQVGLLDLTEDTEITVAAGDRYEICTLSASAIHTLTKKGEGDLYIGRVTSLNPRIDLQEGHLYVGPNLTKPTLFASAAFHVDANEAETLTKIVDDDKTYVSKWSDVNGGTHYASNATAGRQPWLTTLENGNAMLDFGSLKNAKTSGIGGNLVFDGQINGIRAAFCVQKIHPETLPVPESSCSQGISCYYYSVFMPYLKAEGKGPSYANKWQDCTKQVRAVTDQSGLGGSISVNGKVLSTVGTAASTDLEVVDYKIVDPVSGGTDYGKADRFAADCAGNSAGGMMIGEAAIFTTPLTDEQHELLSHYLMAKWVGYGIPRVEQISVGAGTSASIWNGAAYDVIGHTTQVGVLDLTEDIVITVAAGDRYEICTLSASEVHTLTKKGEGDLYVGRVTSVNPRIDLQGGHLFVGPKLSEPALFFSSSVFHVDANATNTLTTAEADGKTYVSKWGDVNGGTHYASNATEGRQPWLTTLENGLSMLDFGTLKNDKTSGFGGNLTFDSRIEGIRAAFCVQKIHPETLPIPQSSCSQGIGCYYDSVFMTYLKAEGKGPSYANKWQACTKQVRATNDESGLGGSISVNGKVLPSVGTAASTDMEVVDYRIVDPVSGGTDYGRADRFAVDYASKSTGGMKIGEAAFFTTTLTDAQHELINHYLLVKWIEYGIPRVEQIAVGEGTSASIWNGASYDVIEYQKITQVGLLDLTEDVEITVAAGERYEIFTLSASDAHKLIKRGGGDLYIGRVTSSNPRIDVQGGRLFVGPTLTKPAIFFSSAAFHVDANEADTMAKIEDDDKTYVSKWSDVNGGTHYASNATEGRQPWLTTLENGNVMLDFGTLKNDKLSGVGGYLTFDSKITGVRAAFCVQKFHDETIAAQSCVCSQGISSYDQGVFSPYSKPEGKGPSYANKWQGFTKQVRDTDDGDGTSNWGLGGSISVNGVKLASVITSASANLEVIDYKIVDPASGGTDCGYADRFAQNFWNQSAGGMMIGEAAIFTTPLTDEQHELVSNYLMVKWLGYKIPRARQITIGEGANAFFWNGTSYEEVEYKGLILIFR